MTTATARKIEFVCKAVKWFDKVNGNTYHSVRITRCSDGQIAFGEFEYGYGDQYRQTALTAMEKAGWFRNIKRKAEGIVRGKVDYTPETLYLFERENGYPIEWIVSEGLKRECIANGKAR